MTFIVQRLWLVSAAIVATSAQVVTYLGRPWTEPHPVTPGPVRPGAVHISPASAPLRGGPAHPAGPSVRGTTPHRTAVIASRWWSPRKIHSPHMTTLPLLDELSVILSESRRLGDGQKAPIPGGAGESEDGTTDGGAATYLSAALYTAGDLGEQLVIKDGSEDGTEVSNADELQPYGDASAPSQRISLLDRLLNSAVKGSDDGWRGIEGTSGADSEIGAIEVEQPSSWNDYQPIPSHKTYNTNLRGTSLVRAPFVPKTAPMSDAELPVTTIRDLPTAAPTRLTPTPTHFTSAPTHFPAELIRSPAVKPKPTVKPSLASHPDRKQHRRRITTLTAASPLPVLTSRGSPVARSGGATVAGGGASEASKDNVPGRPDQDYPTFSEPPVTGFSCRGKVHGMYADFETRCQMWHFCHENGHHRFLCLTGTVFSPVSRTCDWWYNVDCRYDAFPPY